MTLQQIAMRPTAFAHTPSPGARTGLQNIATMSALGGQDRRAQEVHDIGMEKERTAMAEEATLKGLSKEALALWKADDDNGLQTKIAEIASISPQAANELKSSLGTLKYQNFAESAYRMLSAHMLQDPEAQNTLLDQAAEVMDLDPNHAFVQQIKGIKDLPQGLERTKRIAAAVEFASAMGVFPVLEERAKYKAKAGAGAAGEIQKQVNVLRESVKQPRKIYSQVVAAKNRIDEIWSDATGASDLALIFNFMKMHDPESVVREAEFKTAEQARSFLEEQKELGVKIPSFIDVFVQKLETGARLTDTQREDMKNVSDKMEGSAQRTYDTELTRMLEMGAADQISPIRILGAKRFKEYQQRQQKPIEIQPGEEVAQDSAGNKYVNRPDLGGWININTRELYKE